MIRVQPNEWEIIREIINAIREKMREEGVVIIPEKYKDKVFYDTNNDVLHIRRVRSIRKKQSDIFGEIDYGMFYEPSSPIFTAPVYEDSPVFANLNSVVPTRISDIEEKPGVENLNHSFVVTGLTGVAGNNCKVIALGRKYEDATLGRGANGAVVEALVKSFDHIDEDSPEDLCAVKKMRTSLDNPTIDKEVESLKLTHRLIGNLEYPYSISGPRSVQYRSYIVQEKIAGQDLERIQYKHYGDYHASVVTPDKVLKKTLDDLNNRKDVLSLRKKNEERNIFLEDELINIEKIIPIVEHLQADLPFLGLSGNYVVYNQLQDWFEQHKSFYKEENEIKLYENLLDNYLKPNLEMLAKYETLSKSKMLAYAISATQSMSEFHDFGRLLVDFKGANIMGRQYINEKGVLLTETKLIDFGSSIEIGIDEEPEVKGLLDDVVYKSGQNRESVDNDKGEARAKYPAHTPSYAAPEVVTNDPREKNYDIKKIDTKGYKYGTKTDVFALGKTLQEDLGLEFSLAAKLLTLENPDIRIDLKTASEILKLEFVLAARTEFQDGDAAALNAYTSNIAGEYNELETEEIISKLKELVSGLVKRESLDTELREYIRKKPISIAKDLKCSDSSIMSGPDTPVLGPSSPSDDGVDNKPIKS